MSFNRGSRAEVFCEKGVLKNFAKFKPASLPATSIKKRLWHRCFPVNFEKFVRTPFLSEHLGGLLLLQMLLRCCLIDTSIWRHVLYFVPMSRTRLFMSDLCDVLFILICILIMINRIISWMRDTCSFAYFKEYALLFLDDDVEEWVIFKEQQFTLRVLLSICLIFFASFSLALLIKVFLIKKRVVCLLAKI